MNYIYNIFFVTIVNFYVLRRQLFFRSAVFMDIYRANQVTIYGQLFTGCPRSGRYPHSQRRKAKDQKIAAHA